jgi:hypothetical protein
MHSIGRVNSQGFGVAFCRYLVPRNDLFAAVFIELLLDSEELLLGFLFKVEFFRGVHKRNGVNFAQGPLALGRVHMVVQYLFRGQIGLIGRERVGPFDLLDLGVQNFSGFVVLIDGFEVLDKIGLFLLSFRTAHFFGEIILGLSEVDGLAAFLDLFDDGFGTVFVKVFHGWLCILLGLFYLFTLLTLSLKLIEDCVE